jgi:hypothetical protein
MLLLSQLVVLVHLHLLQSGEQLVLTPHYAQGLQPIHPRLLLQQ